MLQLLCLAQLARQFTVQGVRLGQRAAAVRMGHVCTQSVGHSLGEAGLTPYYRCLQAHLRARLFETGWVVWLRLGFGPGGRGDCGGQVRRVCADDGGLVQQLLPTVQTLTLVYLAERRVGRG